MDKKDLDITAIPKEDTCDQIYTALKAAISAVPLAGGPAGEYLKYFIVPSIELRRDEWMKEVAIRLVECEKNIHGLSIEELARNELFITIVLNASQVAIRNHQKEKLTALQNAIINTAKRILIGENLQLLFINMIDSLTPLHIKLLKYFQNPDKWIRENMINDVSLVKVIPEFDEYIGMYSIVANDLASYNLVERLSIAEYKFDNNYSLLRRSITTPVGEQLLIYISDTDYR